MLARLLNPSVNVPRCCAVLTALWVTASFNLAGPGVAHAADPAASAQPAPQHSATDKGAAEKPVAEKPAVEKPVAEKPAVEKPVAEKPAVEKPVAEKPAAEKPKATVATGIGELSTTDRALLTELLTQAGAGSAALHTVERSPERQVSVMLRLAQADLVKAKAMYCSAGDRVLDRFDAAASAEKNHAVMLEALVAVLPEARGIGCLNHIRNTDVLSVDVYLTDVPEGGRTTLVKAAEAAVSAGKIARFLAPPREPEAFHFEFKRRSE